VVFRQLYSGSKGNMYEVTFCNGKRLMIEAGVVWSELLKALKHNFDGIQCCFASHGDLDHAMSIKKVMQAGVDLYASEETFDSQGLLNERRAKVVKDKDLVRLDGFDVYCFATNHDREGSLGFVVREVSTNEYLLFATDTRSITPEFTMQFSIVCIECSYNETNLSNRVKAGEINEEYAKRLQDSHMSKQTAINYLSTFCNLRKCREIHLLHMSSSNIDNEKTRHEIEGIFMIRTEIV